MTTRAMGSMAAALLAAAGLCSAATSDNKGNPQGALGISPKIAPPDAPAAPKPPVPAPAASDDALWDSVAQTFSRYKAETKPSRDTTMQFGSQVQAQVSEILAYGGKRVKKGDVLIRARDTEIVAALNQQRDLAQNDLEIQGAEKQAELTKFKYDRLKGSGTAAPTEFEEARIAADVARVQRDQAIKNRIQQDLKLKQFEGQYERYWLEAPFDGIVEEVMVDVGQGCTEQEKVLRIVNTDKLWLDPYADTKETIKLALKEGSPAWVLIDMPDAPKMVKGKVLYVSPVAESVSQTRRVRVEIDNPQGWPAGTQARVRFTEPGTDWARYQAQVSIDVQKVNPDAAHRAAFLATLPMLTDDATSKPAAATEGQPVSKSDSVTLVQHALYNADHPRLFPSYFGPDPWQQAQANGSIPNAWGWMDGWENQLGDDVNPSYPLVRIRNARIDRLSFLGDTK